MNTDITCNKLKVLIKRRTVVLSLCDRIIPFNMPNSGSRRDMCPLLPHYLEGLVKF